MLCSCCSAYYLYFHTYYCTASSSQQRSMQTKACLIFYESNLRNFITSAVLSLHIVSQADEKHETTTACIANSTLTILTCWLCWHCWTGFLKTIVWCIQTTRAPCNTSTFSISILNQSWGTCFLEGKKCTLTVYSVSTRSNHGNNILYCIW